VTIVEQHEKILGRRWRDWPKEERMAFACTLEEEDIRIPLLVNIAMEAYLGGMRDLMRPSTVAMIEDVIRKSGENEECL